VNIVVTGEKSAQRKTFAHTDYQELDMTLIASTVQLVRLQCITTPDVLTMLWIDQLTKLQ